MSNRDLLLIIGAIELGDLIGNLIVIAWRVFG